MIPAWLAGIWAKIVFVGAFVGLLLLAAFRLIATGRNAERAEATEKGVEAIKRANKAAQNVDTSAEAIANDPNNLDR